MKIKWLRPLLFAVLLLLTLWLLQRLTMPKYIHENEEGVLAAEYYDNAGDNDILFIGDCEVYSNFSPITLWKDYGITSVIRGTPQQMIWQSYYMLEDTLRYETPKVVVFNVYSMCYDKSESEAYNRLALDGLRWSKVKADAVRASMEGKETFASYLFPLLRFHSRWKELEKDDFTYLFRSEQLSHNGYVMRVDTKPVTTLPQPIPLADYRYSDTCWGWLDKIRDCCKEHGISLILIKSPSCYPTWYDEWDAQIADYAAANDLTYINFLAHQEETGIDYTTDTYDAGQHLNLSGAEKASAWFGKILAEQPGVLDRRSDDQIASRWQEKILFYEQMKASQEKQLEETGAVTSYR
ncbi:MAG: SGNH/GDSL hydrolase family protein [Lachnospiraceae bacterium]|nr:SGNH/GDSL hydrolase family protein [Lachnospiraceae bacterium]